MSNINYIDNNTISITRDENYGYSTHNIEYDTSILKLVDKIYTYHEEDGFPPNVKYIFTIIKHNSTKIKFTEYHDLYGNIDEYIDINHYSGCIIN